MARLRDGLFFLAVVEEIWTAKKLYAQIDRQIENIIKKLKRRQPPLLVEIVHKKNYEYCTKNTNSIWIRKRDKTDKRKGGQQDAALFTESITEMDVKECTSRMQNFVVNEDHGKLLARTIKKTSK